MARANHAWAALAVATLLLGACGGGGGGNAAGDPGAPASCAEPERKDWLRAYMGAWYLWAEVGPSPDPAPFATLDAYFDALRYEGDGVVPPDRFSFFQSTESYERFYGEGRTLGYGLFVAGLEVEGRPELPLRVRHVEPASDAGRQGLQRGDRILTLNGRPAAELVARGDFALLSPAAEGDRLALTVQGGDDTERTLTLTASVYALTPVPVDRVLDSPGGRRVGYLMVKDMVPQALAPLDAAFARFAGAHVDELVLDLRYNGGGRVTVGRTLASYVGGARSAGADYTRLLYNAQQAAREDRSYGFENPPAALGLPRVVVLTGPRTCSASEQVVNGLAPFVDVVVIGDTSCGKPVGSLPRNDGCGRTWSVVNFESVNATGQGRWYAGFAPACAAGDDLDHALGDAAEGLLGAALTYLDHGVCPADARRAVPLAAPRGPLRARGTEPGVAPAMVAD